MSEDRVIGLSHHRVWREGPPLVMAEIGVNHDGDRDVARQLVQAAHDAGADAVKFQLFEAKRLLAREAGLVAYQKGSAASAEELLEHLELKPQDMAELIKLAHRLRMAALVTPFSPELAGVAARCGANAIKLASPDLVNRPLVEAAMATGLPLVLSTGAARLEEIGTTLSWLDDAARARTIVLQCVSAYPTAEADASLAGIRVLRLAWPELPIGYSDHTMLSLTGALAVSAGACLLEKHLTLDKSRRGPDHAASLEPAELAEYVRLARLAFRMRGPLEKRVLPVEQEIRQQTRQSVAAAVDLAPGTILGAAHLTVKRPGTGLPAAGLKELFGRRVIRPVAAGSLLQLADLGDPED